MASSRWSLWAKIAGDEKAARVYDCLLGHGTLPPKEVAARLGCPRTTLYAAFDWLKRHGLVSVAGKGRSARLVAASPSRWRAVVEARRAETDAVLADVDRHMDEWVASYQQGTRPRVRAFEGEGGLRSVREEIIRTGGEIWEYFAVDPRLREQASLGERDRIRHSAAVSKGRVLLGLARPDDVPPFFDRRGFEARWISLDKTPFSGSLTLVAQRGYFISPHEGHFGLVVESPETVGLLRSLYEGVWRQAEPWKPPAGWGI